MSKIQRYRAKIHEHNYEPQHATMCLSEDVEKLEATLAERDAEIERLTLENARLKGDLADIHFSFDEVVKEYDRLKAERDDLKTTLVMMGSCYVDDREHSK